MVQREVTGMPWWQRGAIYQIYPRSFADGDGDGIGDLRGIRHHLDHLSRLGVVGVWISPIFRSPMADFGYDVADYRDVDPLFGDLDDLDALIADCHDRGIRVILDWVANHTSDQHPWFVASRSSRDDPRRDWYVWHDGDPEGGPPNDWRSEFPAVGTAWTFDDATRQWYLHSYLPQQPDLNWDNPDVEAAMHDVIRFWFDRGVDGLRIDAVQRLAHDPLLRRNAGSDRRHDQDWHTTHDRIRGIRRVVNEYDDRMIVGEVYLRDLDRVVAYLNDADQLHLAHNFVFLELPWEAEAFRACIDTFTARATDAAWPAWMLSSHDHSRLATRYGHDGCGQARARAATVLLYMLRGTPFMYQGEELALPDADIPPDRVVDVDGRDPGRAPIPWQPPSIAGPGAGFTTCTPWLPVTAEAERLAVARQEENPESTLRFVRRVARMRASTRALQVGAQTLVDAGPGVLAWTRADDDECYLIAVNFTDQRMRLRLNGAGASGIRCLSSTPQRNAVATHASDITLTADEAAIIRM